MWGLFLSIDPAQDYADVLLVTGDRNTCEQAKNDYASNGIPRDCLCIERIEEIAE